jgi:hypothetical protein
MCYGLENKLLSRDSAAAAAATHGEQSVVEHAPCNIT